MTPELPVVRTTEQLGDANTDRSDATVVGVVLAAGTSSRFGEPNKLLAELDGATLVRHATTTLLDAGLDTIVVLGHEATAVQAALDGLDVSFIENAAFAAGQATSVEAGVEAAAERDASAALFFPGDMPFVDSDTVERLVWTYQAGVGTALAAAFEGQRGNPVLFDRDHFSALRDVSGDKGGREVLLNSGGGALVEVPDPGVTLDIDTRDDLDDHALD